MIQVNLDPVPNQSFSVTLENAVYDFSIFEANGVMGATIVKNNILLQSGARLVGGTPVFPYKYQNAGNFLLLTADGELPYYTQFNITQFLMYITIAELARFYAR